VERARGSSKVSTFSFAESACLGIIITTPMQSFRRCQIRLFRAAFSLSLAAAFTGCGGGYAWTDPILSVQTVVIPKTPVVPDSISGLGNASINPSSGNHFLVADDVASGMLRVFSTKDSGSDDAPVSLQEVSRQQSGFTEPTSLSVDASGTRIFEKGSTSDEAKAYALSTSGVLTPLATEVSLLDLPAKRDSNNESATASVAGKFLYLQLGGRRYTLAISREESLMTLSPVSSIAVSDYK
jgi:hypothetical protein